MRHVKSLLPLFVFPFLFLAAAAQDLRRNAGESDASELKRGAHRVNVSVEQLKHARHTLREATDLAMRLESVPPHYFGVIGSQWVEMDRSQSTETLESLFNFLRSGGQASTTVGEYQRYMESAVALLSANAGFDSNRAVQLAREWPEPPKSQDGSAQGTGEPLLSQFLKHYLPQIAYRDPDKALSLLGQWDASSEPDYGLHGMLANELSRRGRREEALKLIDQAITHFRLKPTPGALRSYVKFLSHIVSVDSNRFKNGFKDLAQYVFQPGSRVRTDIRNGIGNEIIRGNFEERSILSVFLALPDGHEMLLKLLDTLPELKAKIDLLGGLERFYYPNLNASRKPPEASSRIQLGRLTGGEARRVYMNVSPAPRSMDSPSQLMHELRGKTVKNRAMVRDRLTQVAGTPEERFHRLLGLAQIANHEDPDLSSLALKTASGLIAKVEPLQQRRVILENLIQLHRQLGAEVDPNLIKDGFVLADEMREQEKTMDQPGNAPRRVAGLSPADLLEMTLLSEYARDNFDAAIRYVRSLPDNEFKLAVLTQMAQSLR